MEALQEFPVQDFHAKRVKTTWTGTTHARGAIPKGFENGAEGSRTLDLLHAMQTLSQLSYGPRRSC